MTRAAVLLTLLALVPPQLAAAAASEPKQEAVLQALDKVTARVSRLDVPVGGSVAFGSLTIAVEACYAAPPTEPPESAAFLEIEDRRPGTEGERVFSGWMFASSPAVSALEHPVYDVTVMECRDPKPQ